MDYTYKGWVGGRGCSVERYHIFTSGIRYYKLRMVFGIARYLIKHLDEPLSSVNG